MIRIRAAVISFAVACWLLAALTCSAQVPQAPSAAHPPAPAASPARDLAKTPTLYVVPYAHLDTEWRWEYPQVISEYLTKTMRNNFALFERYPHYVFNFTGANRYAMMKEYFPADFARLQHYVAAGRWFPAGSSVEESDVNSPSAESILRQVLYGNEFFRQEFHKASHEFMLPDCFGFPASLPSLLAHAGIRGFSTQKLSAAWQPAARVGGPSSPEQTPEGIPFNVGVWEGTDGHTIIAALNPGSYDGDVYTDLSRNNPPPAGNARGYVWDWPDRVSLNGKVTGVFADYHYVGTGDIGGSANEFSVRLLEAIASHTSATLPPFPPPRGQPPAPASTTPVKMGDGPLHIVTGTSEQMFLDIKPAETGRMPRYKGDLELINHSAGSLTSQAYHKRWNRENEVLADAAEKASVAAAWLGGRPYPAERLTRAWRLVLGGQFHDIMAGTATPKSYEYAWNDDVLAMNQFAGVLTSASEAVASVMNTRTEGVPLVVFNSLNIEREDVVEAQVDFPQGAPAAVRVLAPGGAPVPAQLDSNGRVVFVAKVPSVGYAVYDVQPVAAAEARSELSVSETTLENARYCVGLDHNGDVFSVFDKRLNRELLAGPVRLAISTDNPEHWPAWNMDFADEQRGPHDYVSGAVSARVVENGPARVAVEVTRQTAGSRFVQTVRLAAGGAGNRVEFVEAMDWKTKESNLKAVFTLAAVNKNATYNWDVGVVERPNEDERQFEVATHQWIDLTDQSGGFGATILTDKKYASDKPSDNTVRLTLVRTPGTRGGYTDQGSQDIGHHDLLFGLAGHESGWRQGDTDWEAYRLNTPLFVFQGPKHEGALGKSFSLLKTSSKRVRVLAIKKAEASDDVVLRIVDTSGRGAELENKNEVTVTFPAPVTSVREVNAQEQPLAAAGSVPGMIKQGLANAHSRSGGPQPATAAALHAGALLVSLGAWEPRTFALKLGAARARARAPASRPLDLKYDASVSSFDGKPATGCFDCSLDGQTAPQGNALPAEMLPRTLNFNGIRFTLGAPGQPNALTAHGQVLDLPAGNFNRVYVLAAAYSPEREGSQANANPLANQDDATVTFAVDQNPAPVTVQNWTGLIGQWDSRQWQPQTRRVPLNRNDPSGPTRTITTNEFTGQLNPGFIKRADVAWFASHHHGPDGGNLPYQYSYLFAYPLDLPSGAGAKSLTLPENEHVRILAITAVQEPSPLRAAHPLYDVLEAPPR